jgi:glucose-1-phosphate adenylyltransferase
VGVTMVPLEEAHRFGTVTVGASGRITSFLEKSALSQSRLASMGIYIFDKKVLVRRLAEDAADRFSRHDFGYSILPGTVKSEPVFAYRFEGDWQDIGTVEAYYGANMALTGEPAESVLPGEYGRSCRAAGDADVKNSLVSHGCIIKGRVENSVLSPGVFVDEQASVKNSIIMENSYIGYHSVIDHCVLDEGVNVAEYCYIGFGSGETSGGHDLTIIGREAGIPPHLAIGSNCRIMPFTGPGDFNTNIVLADTVVTRNASVLR